MRLFLTSLVIDLKDLTTGLNFGEGRLPIHWRPYSRITPETGSSYRFLRALTQVIFDIWAIPLTGILRFLQCHQLDRRGFKFERGTPGLVPHMRKLRLVGLGAMANRRCFTRKVETLHFYPPGFRDA